MRPFVIHAFRGPLSESFHHVHALWIDERGSVVRSWGDEERLVCPRSAMKPIQAIPLVLSKGFESAPDPLAAIAIACASHKAEDRQVDFVRLWLQKLGRSEDELVCGVQPPEGFEKVRAFLEGKKKLGRALNNCSGKHTGMLATCAVSGFPQQGYHLWDHPLQQRIRQIATQLSGVDWDQAPYGIDGCGLPNYHVPLNALGRGLSRFLWPEKSPFTEALQWITRAWSKEPYMIAGHGDLGSELAALTEGRVVAKIGAQGNFMALDYQQGRCLVLKVEDGSSRAAEEALITILKQENSITEVEEAHLRRFVPREIRNWAGDLVGSYTAEIEI